MEFGTGSGGPLPRAKFHVHRATKKTIFGLLSKNNAHMRRPAGKTEVQIQYKTNRIVALCLSMRIVHRQKVSSMKYEG